MFTSKLIRVNEANKLVGTECEGLIPHLTPDGPYVLVVEKDDFVVGTWALIETHHAECVGIHPAYRNNPVVARRLIRGMMQMARAVGAKNLVTAALTEDVEKLIVEHLDGTELPGKHFVFPVKGL